MEIIVFYGSIILIITLFTYLFSKFTHLKDDKKKSSHKNFVKNSRTPVLIGGILIFLVIIIFLENLFFLKLLFCLILLLGFFSDKNLINSPKTRFFLQIGILFILFYNYQIFVEDIRIGTFNYFLENLYFKLIFTIFCVLVLINGANFIDGVNTLASGYFLLVIIFLYQLMPATNNELISFEFLEVIIFVLTVITVFNFFDYIYLGDSGAYILGTLTGMLSILTVNENSAVSPYFIALILWYPAYETLFSIIRKLVQKKSIMKPDNNHLHQLIYLFLCKKINKKNFCNSLTGISINMYNFIIIYFGFLYNYNTKLLLILILICVSIYNLTYLFLKKNFHNH